MSCPSLQLSGFPSPPRVSFPRRDVRCANCGPHDCAVGREGRKCWLARFGLREHRRELAQPASGLRLRRTGSRGRPFSFGPHRKPVGKPALPFGVFGHRRSCRRRADSKTGEHPARAEQCSAHRSGAAIFHGLQEIRKDLALRPPHGPQNRISDQQSVANLRECSGANRRKPPDFRVNTPLRRRPSWSLLTQAFLPFWFGAG
jgi:hypothetical protein